MWSISRGTWTINAEYPCYDVTQFGQPGPAMIAGAPVVTISGLVATQEQALRYFTERSCRGWYDNSLGPYTIDDMRITREEAKRIAAGEDPHAVLLGGSGKCWLTVVPWTPS